MSRFFGAWLIEQGRLTAEQVVCAVDQQHRRRIPLGRLALAERLLTVREVYEILAHGRSTRQLFGQKAVELGFLQPSDVERLLSLQRELEPPFEEVLLELGMLDRSTLEQLRHVFQREMERREDSAVALGRPD